MISEIKLTPRRRTLLQDMGIFSIEDLVNYYPKKYEDLRPVELTKENDDKKVVCVGKVYSEVKNQRIRKSLSRMQFMMEIDEELYTITIFNRDYLYKTLYMNRKIKVVGKLDYYHKSILASNIYFDVTTNVVSNYKLVDGLKDGEMKAIVKDGLNYLKNSYKSIDILPSDLIAKYRLDSKLTSLNLVHFPSTIDDVKRGYRHLKYEEFLEFVTTLEINKRAFKSNEENLIKNIDKNKVNKYIESLPFKLSKSQALACEEIINDMNSGSIMYRILQGDVGSGKTLVAIIALVANSFASFQGAMMAPTDLLARQHYNNLVKLLKDTGLKVELLVSDMETSKKKKIKENLANGSVDIVVGTHALIQKDVAFKNLGLAIIDEQHRFGVRQRQQLKEKGQKVDLLLMSATPIPRTLAHTIYGELDISTLDEFPSGKRDVKTYFVEEKDESRMLSDIQFILNKGKRVYVICPLIEGSSTKKSVLSTYQKYQEKFQNYGVGYLHGKMDDADKNSILESFASGKINVLVSTTVIEVGIDIKDAEAIIIYGANNFGLAQLHQLRGRVGRNGNEGYCYLVSETDDEDANDRLKILCETDDGFKVSEYDMQKRGVGDIIGTKQSGVSDLKIANIIDDYHILEIARKDCKMIFSNSNELEYSKYLAYIRSKINENMAIIG